ncbi:unnamed protein product [Rangifer tarandus platyrhynchus]|uniref:Uncharacterized protein n=2 Tax=Rangifer tarandus platyrhynchus TaxID=3082113 RepID=A0ABN8YU39_RANTA|nr:unnamed protein product [Rangifer tarandus platyrhynchus]CAI9702650.1 unnamed protein product [Rangifer tarandus platyrhynchus]
MKPGVLAASDGELQPEDEPERPPPGRHPDAADKQSPPPPQQHRWPRADRGREKEGDSGPEEQPEKARPLTRPDLPFYRPLPLAPRNL